MSREITPLTVAEVEAKDLQIGDRILHTWVCGGHVSDSYYLRTKTVVNAFISHEKICESKLWSKVLGMPNRVAEAKRHRVIQLKDDDGELSTITVDLDIMFIILFIPKMEVEYRK